MSKKVIYAKHIEKGRFYHIHEGSKTGHPGMVYWKNDKRNLYLAILTGTSDGRHRTTLQAPTNRNVERSAIQNRPVLAKRKDIGGAHLDYRFSKKDKELLKAISIRPFKETPTIRKQDRRYIKRLKKKPRY